MRAPLLVILLAVGCGDDDPPMDPDGGAGADAGVDVDAPAAVDAAFVCDPVAQDCGDDKCTFVDPESDGFVAACVPVTGDGALGDACVREADGAPGLGHDDCGAGLFCSYIGVVPPAAGGTRLCRAICDADVPCSDGERCAELIDDDGDPAGICGATCAPFAGDCSDGMSCADLWTGLDGDFDFFLVCRVAGAVAIDAPCDDDEQCVADAICFGLPGAPSACRALCDDAHPCDRGAACFQPGGAAVGACLPET